MVTLYKVVRRDRHRWISPDVYASIYATGPLLAGYALGLVTQAEPALRRQGFGLLAFENQERARQFARRALETDGILDVGVLACETESRNWMPLPDRRLGFRQFKALGSGTKFYLNDLEEADLEALLDDRRVLDGESSWRWVNWPAGTVMYSALKPIDLLAM
jgi:hypothetical protein